MAYSPQTWANGQAGATPLSAARLNHIESGVSVAQRESAPFTALGRALADASQSAAIQVFGDSTSNDSTEWFRLLAADLATDYPTWTVHHRLWADSTQAYGTEGVLQTGTAGERYLDCSTGTSTRRMAVAQSPHLSGTIDVRLRIQMSDWTPNAGLLVGRFGSVGFRSWRFLINTAGQPAFTYSTDGSAVTTMTATAANGITDGTTSWIRALFVPDDGAGNRSVSFYKGSDGVTWTQIGSTVTAAGAVSLFDPEYGYEVGGIAGGRTNATLKVMQVEIRDGDTGPTVTPCLPDLWPPYDANAPYFAGAPILTFVNGSVAGAGISYLGDATRLPKMAPDYGQRVVFLSTSHNEGKAIGREWTNSYDTWRTAVATELPHIPQVVLTQNPETASSTWYREHAQRRVDLLAYAHAAGLSVIDTYRAFIDYGDWTSDLLADSVHPNAAGSTLWADHVKQAIDAA